MTIVLLILTSESISNSGERLDLIATITRGYLKLPYAYCLLLHQIHIYQIKSVNYFKEFQSLDYVSYKQKVLGILKAFINKYQAYSYLRNAIADLNWCAFIIQNDYLQISNSISQPQRNNST